MEPVSRRSVLAGAGVAAGGLAVGLPVAATATPAAAATARPVRLEDGAVVHVRDVERGELVVMGDDHEVTVVDRQLVAALQRALRTQKGR
jgi:hypothetical protein